MYIHYFTIFSKTLYLYLGSMKADRPTSADLSNIEESNRRPTSAGLSDMEESKRRLGYQLRKIG